MAGWQKIHACAITASKGHSNRVCLRHVACFSASSRNRSSGRLTAVLDPEIILVIDDDLDAREALSEFLKVNGYVVACAENGQVALDQIETWQVPPGLIVLDVQMPVMDGRAFLHRARQDYQIKDVPIIVATAYPSSGAPGATAILSKPLRPERLLSVVRQLFQPAEAASDCNVPNVTP
jgi:CheY-like chemotaxis protein